MKAKLLKGPDSLRFVPFKLEFIVESPEEARLFFHITNNIELLLDLQKGTEIRRKYHFDDYDHNISGYIEGGLLWSEIRSELEKQGYKV
jgi:hypothetical protein